MMHMVTCTYFPAPTYLHLLTCNTYLQLLICNLLTNYLQLPTCNLLTCNLSATTSLQLPLHPPPGKRALQLVTRTHATRTHATHTGYSIQLSFLINSLWRTRASWTTLGMQQLENTRASDKEGVPLNTHATGQHRATWGNMRQYLREHCAFVALVFTSGDQLRRVYL